MIRRGRPYLEFRSEPASPETAQLEREGYTIIRGLLDADELSELRREVSEVFEKVRDGLNPDRQRVAAPFTRRSAVIREGDNELLATLPRTLS